MKRRRRKQLHSLIAKSSSNEQVDAQEDIEGADDVPDVPIPTSEDPEKYSSGLPMGDLNLEGEDEVDYKEPDVDSKDSEPGFPFSPTVVVTRQTSTSRQTSV